MPKNTLWSRLRRWFKSEANAALDRAENPAKMLDQLIREYTDNVKHADSEIASIIGNLRFMEAERDERRREAEAWGLKAEQASGLADRATTDAERARLNELARAALRNQIVAEERSTALDPQIGVQSEQVEQLKRALVIMHDKLRDVRGKRDQLVARSQVAQAQERMVDAVRAIDADSATGELSRVESQVRRREALAHGKAELAASSTEAQFRALDAADIGIDVETRLARLKSGGE